MTLILMFQLMSGPVLYCILTCFVPCSLYEINYCLNKLKDQICTNYKRLVMHTPKPGLELYKQIVEVAFHVIQM